MDLIDQNKARILATSHPGDTTRALSMARIDVDGDLTPLDRDGIGVALDVLEQDGWRAFQEWCGIEIFVKEFDVHLDDADFKAHSRASLARERMIDRLARQHPKHPDHGIDVEW